MPSLSPSQPIKLDVTSKEDIQAAAQAYQDVNILINNAGVAYVNSHAAPTSIDEARQEIETNYLGTLAISLAFAPILKQNGGGALVNMLSVASWYSNPVLGSYGASKAAAWSITNSIRMELRAQGTLVTGIHAGFIDTEMASSFPGPKALPQDIAQATIEGLLADREEVLADKVSHEIKAALAADLSAFYRRIQQQWDSSTR